MKLMTAVTGCCVHLISVQENGFFLQTLKKQTKFFRVNFKRGAKGQ